MDQTLWYPMTIGVPSEQITVFRKAILRWSEGNLRSFPWRATTNPFEILVAEILLQKTPAERVAPIFESLVDVYPTFPILAEAESEEVAIHIESLGLQNQRSRALVEIANELEEEGVPEDAKELQALPHVGRYAASATLCFAFGEPVSIVDANVVRVYERAFGLSLEENADSTWEFAAKMQPSNDFRRYNFTLLDFAALVCKPKEPDCPNCFWGRPVSVPRY